MPKPRGSRLTERERAALMRDVAQGEHTVAELARMHGISDTTVGYYRRIVHGAQKGSWRPNG